MLEMGVGGRLGDLLMDHSHTLTPLTFERARGTELVVHASLSTAAHHCRLP
jgi:hypothetical protein